MSTIIIVCLGVLLTTPAMADDLAKLEAALRSLQQAKQQLRDAGGGFEGHRQNAIERTNQAIGQVEESIKVARKNVRQDEKKVNQLDKQIDKLEGRKNKIEGQD
jgi:chromosome segregation ATPase